MFDQSGFDQPRFDQSVARSTVWVLALVRAVLSMAARKITCFRPRTFQGACSVRSLATGYEGARASWLTRCGSVFYFKLQL